MGTSLVKEVRKCTIFRWGLHGKRRKRDSLIPNSRENLDDTTPSTDSTSNLDLDVWSPPADSRCAWHHNFASISVRMQSKYSKEWDIQPWEFHERCEILWNWKDWSYGDSQAYLFDAVMSQAPAALAPHLAEVTFTLVSGHQVPSIGQLANLGGPQPRASQNRPQSHFNCPPHLHSLKSQIWERSLNRLTKRHPLHQGSRKEDWASRGLAGNTLWHLHYMVVRTH